MASFRLSALAKDDLKQIAIFTQKRWGKNQRNKYLEQFDGMFHQLAENPSLDMSCDFIRSGYRKFPLISHVIYYRTGPDETVDIIRILHKHMDVSEVLFKA
jgi:toxin ParE1/3/4